jgi:hypothetical protein
MSLPNSNDGSKMDWLPVDAAMPALIADWRHRRSAASLQASLSATATVSATLGPEERRGSRLEYPEVLIQAAVISLGDQTAEGRLVEAVAIPWFEIIGQLERDPEFLYKVNWCLYAGRLAGGSADTAKRGRRPRCDRDQAGRLFDPTR